MSRDDEFREIIQHVHRMDFGTRREYEHLRCLWTAYSLHNKLEPDTSEYDNDMMCLFNLVHAVALQQVERQRLNKDKIEKRLYFKAFDDYMAKYLV